MEDLPVVKVCNPGTVPEIERRVEQQHDASDSSQREPQLECREEVQVEHHLRSQGKNARCPAPRQDDKDAHLRVPQVRLLR